MEGLQDYIRQNKNRFLIELFELLRIPSISADQKFNNSMIETANLIKNNLDPLSHKFSVIEI